MPVHDEDKDDDEEDDDDEEEIGFEWRREYRLGVVDLTALGFWASLGHRRPTKRTYMQMNNLSILMGHTWQSPAQDKAYGRWIIYQVSEDTWKSVWMNNSWVDTSQELYVDIDMRTIYILAREKRAGA